METLTRTAENDCLLDVTALIAASVYDTGSRFVGRIEDVIDARGGCIRHAVLVVAGILGIGGTRLAVSWRALTPDVNARRCIVANTLMQLTAVSMPRRGASRRAGMATSTLAPRGREPLGTSRPVRSDARMGVIGCRRGI